MSVVGKLVGSLTGANKAADAATAGAQISADAANRAVDYLKEEERIPQFFRKGSLNIIGGLAGLGDISQADAAAKIKGSEIYKQVLGSRMAGEDAILRNAAATGGLRSGNTSDALARYNAELEQRGFLQSLGVLEGLGQLPSNANNIAAATANVGNILGQGQVAAGQAVAAGRGLATSAALAGLGAFGAAGGFGGSSLGSGLTAGGIGGGGIGGGALGSGLTAGGIGGGGIGGGALGSGITYSDASLKKNIQKISERGGHNWYRWDWSDNAAQFGLHGSSEGVLAQEVLEKNPEAVGSTGGYLTVNYEALGLTQ